jgi:hypothetical protein
MTMFPPRGRTTLFEPDETQPLRVRSRHPVPVEVRVSHLGVGYVDTETPVTDAIRLVLSTGWLGRNDEIDLAEALASIEGVVAPEVVDEDGYAHIALVEPDVPAADRLCWHIKDDLWLIHEGKVNAYLAFTQQPAVAYDTSMQTTGSIDLNAAQALMLVRALCSLRKWQLELQTEFERVATRLRNELRASSLARRIELAQHIDDTFVADNDRYVVSLIVGYRDDEARNVYRAAASALDRTRDLGSFDTVWTVFDRHTGELHLLEQGEVDPDSDDRHPSLREEDDEDEEDDPSSPELA